MQDIDPGFGDELSLPEAMKKLGSWCARGSKHGLLFKGKNLESSVVTLSKIIFAIDNCILCSSENTRLFFRLVESSFVYGPMVLMEYPVKQESIVKGLHVFMKNGNYLFISSEAILPEANIPLLDAEYLTGTLEDS